MDDSNLHLLLYMSIIIGILEILNVNSLKDLLFVSNQVTQYFSY